MVRSPGGYQGITWGGLGVWVWAVTELLWNCQTLGATVASHGRSPHSLTMAAQHFHGFVKSSTGQHLTFKLADGAGGQRLWIPASGRKAKPHKVPVGIEGREQWAADLLGVQSCPPELAARLNPSGEYYLLTDHHLEL